MRSVYGDPNDSVFWIRTCMECASYIVWTRPKAGPQTHDTERNQQTGTAEVCNDSLVPTQKEKKWMHACTIKQIRIIQTLV